MKMLERSLIMWKAWNVRNAKNAMNAGVVYVLLLVLLAPFAIPTHSLQVYGFTSEAIQEAVYRASAGDTLILPEGEYLFDRTVVIDRSIALIGAAEIVDVGVVEPQEPNDPPYWDSPPSVCLAEDGDLTLFQVESDAVTFENLKLVGAVTHEEGSGSGIAIRGYDRLEVRNCEITRFRKGVEFSNALRGVVRGSYLHENYRNGFGYGISVTGETMASGGSQVAIAHNEFTYNRHAIASNSPETRFTVENNYFHDNDLSQWQACVDTHPQGGYALRAVVRNNTFERTRPMAFKSGSLEVTGNYFDPGCGDYSVGGYSRMLDFGEPTHNGKFIPNAILHNIYIGDNANASNPHRRLLWVDDYDYSGETKFVAYNMFVNGGLFTHNSYLSSAPRYPFPDSSPNPFVGHMYITLPGTEERVEVILSNTWYDLHALAVDPEGADDIAEIGVQLLNSVRLAPEAGERIHLDEFSAADSYFMRSVGASAYSRQSDGSPHWSDVTQIRGMYVDGTETIWEADGTHRIHLILRFRVSDRAVRGTWRMFGYARDKAGHMPLAPWHELLEGWPIEVDSDVATSLTGPAIGLGVTPQGTTLDKIYPNPFNSVTTINFTLAKPQHITLSLHTLTGQLLEILYSETKRGGSHSVIWDAGDRASGVYLCRLKGEDRVSRVEKVVLVK